MIVCSQPSVLAAVTVFSALVQSSSTEEWAQGDTGLCVVTLGVVGTGGTWEQLMFCSVLIFWKNPAFLSLVPLFPSCSGWRDPAGHAVGRRTAGVRGAHEPGGKFHTNQ